jgi:C-terminal processing protease CtpA/Prc
MCVLANAIAIEHSNAQVSDKPTAVAPAINQTTELGFEHGEVGQTPPGWSVPTDGWTAILSDESAADGKRSAKLELPGESTAPFGNLMRNLDASAYRGRRVRLSARIRVEGGIGRALMWLRVDRPKGQLAGFFDNMTDRPITSDKWADAIIEGDVDTDAQGLALGVMSQGDAKVFVDAVRLEDLRAAAIQATTPPRPLSQRGLENLQAATRLLAYVRFFHPSDEAQSVKAWDHFATHLMEEIEPAADAEDLARRLQDVFAPIAPALVVWAGGPEVAPPPPPIAPEAETLRYWHHTGAGTIAFFWGNVYASKIVTIPIGSNDSEATDSITKSESQNGQEEGVRPPSPFLVKSLGGGVTCRLPVMVYVGRDGSLPRALSPPEWQENSERPQLTALNRATRLAGVTIAWGVMQHFYPYFDLVKTDWDAALRAALSDAAESRDELAYLRTLQELIAKLHDGHGHVTHARQRATKMLPLALAWAGADLVVTGKHASAPATIAAGDAIVTIDGASIAERCNELSSRISAATDGWRRSRLLDELKFLDPTSTSVRLRLRRPNGQEYDATVSPIRPTAIEDVTTKKPSDGAEMAPGIVYFNLSGAPAESLRALDEKLTAAKGIIFDLRGYPNTAAFDLLLHLIDEPAMSAQWNTPVVTLPDREGWQWQTNGRWTLPPTPPRYSAKIAFLTDGRAISYAESIMGIVEHYRLGEIVGSTTAGTNGNVNPFELPGGYRVVWTGMQVLKHDGSQHHGVGIKPTVPVEPSAAGIATGRDEVLEKAVEVLTRKIQAHQ